MKILFVTPYYKPYLGGIERVIERLASEFLKNNHFDEISVLTTKWSFPRKHHAEWIDREKIDSEYIYRIDSWPNAALPFFQVPLVWFSPLQIRKYIKEVKPNVIQLMSDRWFLGNFWTIFWAKQMKIPVYFSLSYHTLSKMQQWLRPINKWITSNVEKVIVITRIEKQLVRDAYQTSEDKFAVVPWGVELGGLRLKNQKSKNKKEYTDENITILSVGRISKHKGQLWLAERYLSAEISSPSKLVLVGAIEDETIKKQIEQLQFSDNKQVVITGEVSDEELQCWYEKAELFALFPDYEAFGLVFLEAMVHGIPVLTHNVGAIEEVLKDSAVIISRYDESLAEKGLESLLNNPDELKQRGIVAQEYVENNFSWQKTANRFLEIYK